MDVLGANVNIDLMSTADVVMTVVFILLFLAMLGLIGIILIGISKYKHRIVIKEVLRGRKTIYEDKFREFKDKEGNRWFKLLKAKELIPVAPTDVVELTNKARKFVEVYRTQNGEYIWCKDTGDTKEVPGDIQEIKDKKNREAKLKEWREKNNIVEPFQPLTTNQRAMFISQMRKSEERRTNTWKEQLPTMVSIGALVIIVLALMVFWGEIAQPVLKAKDMNNQIVKNLAEMRDIQLQIEQNVQVIKEQRSGDGSAPD